MKKKVDFTVKGTKLPIFPKNIMKGYYRHNMVSFGVNNRGCVLAEEPDYIGNMYFELNLSTIEALAEEQGMLWVEDEAPTPTTLQPSIEHLLIDCITLNNYIKRGERLFDFDERYKLKLLQDSQSKLASKVAELNNILNPQPMQSVVEIAEDVLK